MEKDIRENAAYRERLMETLARSRVAAFYQSALTGALAWADRRFGPEREPYALAWSLWLALAYSWFLFWGIWAASGSGKVFGVDIIATPVPMADRWPVALTLTLGMGLLWLAMHWFGRRIGRWERRRTLHRRRQGQVVWKRRLPLALGIGCPLIALALGAMGETGTEVAGVLGLNFLLVGGSVIGGIAASRIRHIWVAVAEAVALAAKGALAVTGIGALAISGAGAIARAAVLGFLSARLDRRYRTRRRRAIPMIAGLGSALAWGMVSLLHALNADYTAPVVSFFLFLPLANGALDYGSWFVSRRLGRDLAAGLAQREMGRWRLAWRVGWHTVADLGVAVVLLLTLAWVLGLGFGLAEHGEVEAPGLRDLALVPTVRQAVADPWGVQGGLLFSLMLVSTLVPTALHLLFLVASPLALLQAGKSTGERRQLSARLHPHFWEKQTDPERTELANAISRELVHRNVWVWGPAAALLVLVLSLAAAGLGAVVQLSWFAETVNSFACWGVDAADLVFGHDRAVTCTVWGMGR